MGDCIISLKWPYSICLASTPALQAGESSSTLDRVTNMGNGSARGGRLPCKQDIQIGSIPIFSTNRRMGSWVRTPLSIESTYDDGGRALELGRRYGSVSIVAIAAGCKLVTLDTSLVRLQPGPPFYRDIAQFGRALVWGTSGYRFESCYFDHRG